MAQPPKMPHNWFGVRRGQRASVTTSGLATGSTSGSLRRSKLGSWTSVVRQNKHPAIVGALIRLGNCFDLLDPANVHALEAAKDNLVATLKANGQPVPTNVRRYKRFDCAAFNYLPEFAKDFLERKSIHFVRSTSRPAEVPAFGKEAALAKNLTSKSASATRKTFSRSGMPNRTAATASSSSPFAGLASFAQKSGKKASVRRLKRAGILTSKGKLSARYAQEP